MELRSKRTTRFVRSSRITVFSWPVDTNSGRIIFGREQKKLAEIGGKCTGVVEVGVVVDLCCNVLVVCLLFVVVFLFMNPFMWCTLSTKQQKREKSDIS